MRLRLGFAVVTGLGGVLVAMACSKGGGGSASISPNGTSPTLVPKVCQASCNARPADGNEALKHAQYGAAYDAYACGDSPEAAFGAGLTTLLTAIEGESMTKVLGQLGHGPIKATDIVSAQGWFGRYLSQSKGSGMITRTDGAGAPLETTHFGSGRARYDGPTSSASTYSYSSVRMYGQGELAKLSISFSLNTPVTPGMRLSVCSNGGSYASVSYSTPTLSCTSNSSSCTTGGAVVVTNPGTTNGAPVEYQLDHVPMTCSPRSSGGPAAGPPQATPSQLNGSVSTFVASGKVDLTGLSPTLTEPWDTKLPPGVTLEQVVASASGVAGSLELASCYFNAAGSGAGDGKVFEIPSEVFGAAPISVSRGDAKIAAGFASMMAAAIVLVEAYRLPLELRSFVCGSGVDKGPCLSSDEQARRTNAAIGALADREKIAIARRLLAAGLASWSDAPAGLGPSSIFVKDQQSAASVDKVRVFVDKLRESLDKGSVALPFVSPEIRVDLKALFDNPPDPDKISVDPLVYDPQTKQWDLTESFFDQAFPTSTFTWSRDGSQKYVFDNNNGLVLDPMSYRFESLFPF